MMACSKSKTLMWRMTPSLFQYLQRSSFAAAAKSPKLVGKKDFADDEDDVVNEGSSGVGVGLSSGISRPLSEILKELNKKVPDSLITTRFDPSSGSSIRYIPWHIVNRIMNLHAPEWSGEVRNIIYSADGKSVSVVYRVTLYGTDAEVSISPSSFCV
ncbi:OLC1v1018520C1 [Oldenlandia corymbosa var. corymbosa]|uniref:OLC1v1018520C1 n=1 Tax=Oldenlandia corymbosa var. corymbosa TaxID=529605 RepID=A0AAV1EBW4_OLDCO|nr:OLC1v1018520C1 [Oldenlandia corymbosa var. corymbosa]